MANETYTNAPDFVEGEADKVQAIVDIRDAIGAAIDAPFAVALASNAAVISAANFKGHSVFEISGTLSADGTVTVPASDKKFIVKLGLTFSTHTLTVLVSGETGVEFTAVHTGGEFALRCDGTDVVAVREHFEQGDAIADAVDEADAVTKLNDLLAFLRTRGDIAV